MVLSSIYESLEILLGGTITTNPVEWTASWDDSYSGIADSNGTIASAVAKTMVPAPYHTPFSREVTLITVTNKDTVTQTITVRINNNGTHTTLFTFATLPGGQITFGQSALSVVTATGLPAGISTEAKQDAQITLLQNIKLDLDPLLLPGGGAYVRQDSTGTIAKETGGNLATIATTIATLAKESGGNLDLIAARVNKDFAIETGGNLTQIAYLNRNVLDLLYLILIELKVNSVLVNEMLAPHSINNLDRLRDEVNEDTRR